MEIDQEHQIWHILNLPFSLPFPSSSPSYISRAARRLNPKGQDRHHQPLEHLPHGRLAGGYNGQQRSAEVRRPRMVIQFIFPTSGEGPSGFDV
jgi:hypothetical protein